MFRSIRASSAARVLALAAMAVAAAGCTLLGLGVGALVDRGGADRRIIAGWQVATVKPGRSIEVLVENGRLISGRFGGLRRATPAEYAPLYDRWRGAVPGPGIPRLGPGAHLRTRDGESACELVGFDHATVVVRLENRSEDEHVLLEDVVALSDAAGNAIDGAALISLAATGKIPLLTRVMVQTSTARVDLPLNAVARVELRGNAHGGKIVGALVGLGIDLLVVAWLNEPWDSGGIGEGGTCCASSCPWVYSFDGQKYVLEGDALGGALFRASQREDRLPLDKLAAIDGEYRLRLENPQPEIQYVDDVALMVVDHAPGARVVSSPAGLRVLAAPVAPIAATDRDGVDVRALVAEADGRSWTSLPIGLGRADAREALYLEFPRPPEAATVTLAFRTRSTLWASHLLRSLLGLHGRDLPAWFARMEIHDPERQAFEAALRREGLLQLRVWDGGGWKVAGILPPARAATREHAFHLDLPAGVGPLRVELNSVPGLWTVDSALADYGAQPPMTVAELRPVRAHAADGTDLRAALRRPDGRNYAMNEGERVDLAFTVPPSAPGRQRSLVARLSGYYTVLVPSRDAARGALFSRLIAEPGALGQYAATRLSAELAAVRTDD